MLRNIRTLVCGGRGFGVYQHDPVVSDHENLLREMDAELERYFLLLTLFDVHGKRGISTIIHGAARGADSLAGKWGKAMKLPVEPYPADWNLYGRIAGRLRNAEMLVRGKPDLVVAFPGGVGTTHMTTIAREAGVPVYEPDFTKWKAVL